MSKYQVIYADPPWPVKKIVRKVRPNQTANLDYPTMSLDEIKLLDVGMISADNSVLFLWTTQAFLPHAFKVMDCWGFKYQRTITWDKQNGLCLFGFHHRTEFLLFGYKGKIDMYPKRKAFPTLVQAKSPSHSTKPQIFRDLIEPFGSSKIELFARQKTDGWHSWGNEVANDIELNDLELDKPLADTDVANPPTPTDTNTSFKEQLERILEYFRSEIRSDSLVTDTVRLYEATQSIINLVDKELPNCDSGCKHKDTHQGHGTIWWQGYNQAINDMRAIIRSNT